LTATTEKFKKFKEQQNGKEDRHQHLRDAVELWQQEGTRDGGAHGGAIG
jgi:hypothetical protein